MPSYRYEHIHLSSRNAIQTATFYERMFGAVREEVRQNPNNDEVMIFLSLDGTSIVISQDSEQKSDTKPGLDHFGFITDDIEAAVTELKMNGVRVKEEIQELPSMGKQPRRKIAFLLGPENVVIELRELMG